MIPMLVYVKHHVMCSAMQVVPERLGTNLAKPVFFSTCFFTQMSAQVDQAYYASEPR